MITFLSQSSNRPAPLSVPSQPTRLTDPQSAHRRNNSQQALQQIIKQKAHIVKGKLKIQAQLEQTQPKYFAYNTLYTSLNAQLKLLRVQNHLKHIKTTDQIIKFIDIYIPAMSTLTQSAELLKFQQSAKNTQDLTRLKSRITQHIDKISTQFQDLEHQGQEFLKTYQAMPDKDRQHKQKKILDTRTLLRSFKCPIPTTPAPVHNLEFQEIQSKKTKLIPLKLAIQNQLEDKNLEFFIHNTSYVALNGQLQGLQYFKNNTSIELITPYYTSLIKAYKKLEQANKELITNVNTASSQQLSKLKHKISTMRAVLRTLKFPSL